MLVTQHTSLPQSRPRSNPTPRRKGPPAALRIHTPAESTSISVVLGENSASSTLSSANSDIDSSLSYSQFIDKPAKSRSMKNTKNLSLALPPSHSNVSPNSLVWPSESETLPATDDHPVRERKRRPSTLSLPNSNNASSTVARLHRKDEDESPQPYVDGPVQILPGVWLGSEDNARDWKSLMARGIRSILNVAKEVASPFDSLASSQPLRPVASASDLAEQCRGVDDATFYPAHGPSGRPAMHYLKLPWSHGQPDLVNVGFVKAMEFIDAALDHGDGVLIHCQCGVSRSATVVIALVMRAAALSSPSVPPEVWALKDSGMHGAYSFVKDKSKCIGPNMSLIYQLLEYEHKLQRMGSSVSTSERSSAIAEEEEEWSRRRQILEDDAALTDMDRESAEVIREARALDKAMEERIVARKASSSSAGSSSGGLGMGAAWKSRYGGRARTGSIASNFTTGSMLSEDLVEENEEHDLLGVGGGFDCPSISARSPSEETAEEDSRAPSVTGQSDHVASTSYMPSPLTARPEPGNLSCQLADAKPSIPPPSAPATKTSFGFTPRLPFRFRSKRRQSSLVVLPPVPSSPVVAAAPPQPPEVRKREAKRVPPPLRLESTTHGRTASLSSQSSLKTASQTLFLFPPSPTLTTQTPSTVTITSSVKLPARHAALCTPRVSSFDLNGRRRSFIGLGIPPTPTTACSRVDVRGWVGIGPG